MVNWTEVDVDDLVEKFKQKDKFQVLFDLVLEQNFTYPKADIHTKEGQKVWKEVMFNLVEELFEAANTLKNRPWVQTEYEVDLNHLYDELADALWYFVLLIHLSGLNADEMFRIFLAKWKVNNFRRESGY